MNSLVSSRLELELSTNTALHLTSLCVFCMETFGNLNTVSGSCNLLEDDASRHTLWWKSPCLLPLRFSWSVLPWMLHFCFFPHLVLVIFSVEKEHILVSIFDFEFPAPARCVNASSSQRIAHAPTPAHTRTRAPNVSVFFIILTLNWKFSHFLFFFRIQLNFQIRI